MRKSMIRRTLIAALLLSLPLSSQVCAQQKVELTRDQRLVVIDSITSALNRGYVFPEVATRMADDLRAAKGRADARPTARCHRLHHERTESRVCLPGSRDADG